MTNEQLKQTAAAMLAVADGKPAQFKYRGQGREAWGDIEDPEWNFAFCEYRAKPEPRTRPWNNPNDVPGPVCWLRDTTDARQMEQMVTHVDGSGVLSGTGHSYVVMLWSDSPRFEHSTDRKTWHKCEVTE